MSSPKPRRQNSLTYRKTKYEAYVPESKKDDKKVKSAEELKDELDGNGDP